MPKEPVVKMNKEQIQEWVDAPTVKGFPGTSSELIWVVCKKLTKAARERGVVLKERLDEQKRQESLPK